MPDKDNSFKADRGLTKQDREFLSGEMDPPSDNARRQRLFQIRRRVRSMVLDFSLLLDTLNSDHLSQIFHPDDIDKKRELWNAMSDALALFFLQQYEHDQEQDTTSLSDYEVGKVKQNDLVESGLKRMLERRDEELNNYDDFDYSVTPFNPDELLARFQRGERLTFEEFRRLQRLMPASNHHEFAYVRHLAAVMEGVGSKVNDETVIDPDMTFERDLSDDSGDEGGSD
jgi:hypothetical protein